MKVFPPELQVKQFVAELDGAHGFRWRVFTTGSDRHYLFSCVQNAAFCIPVEKARLKDDIRRALARGWGHGARVLVAVIECPNDGTEFEGTWAEPGDPQEDSPEESAQLCPECGHVFTAQWPGYSFRTEAG